MKTIELKIKLSTIKKVQDFIETVSKFTEEITIKSNRYEIDAKSIMNIFTLNLLEDINICLYSDNENIQNKFIREMTIFMEE